MVKTRNAKKAKSRILFAAKKEFAREGYMGARMQRISERANYNKALLHYYFKSKDELFNAVLIHYLRLEPNFNVINYIRNFELSPPENLYLMLHDFRKMLLENQDKDVLKILYREITSEREDFRSTLSEVFLERFNYLQKIIDTGVEKGYFQTSNSSLMVFNIFNNFISYIINRELFINTKIGKNIYQTSIDQISDNIFESIYKSLNRNDKLFEMPLISKKCQGVLVELMMSRN